MPTNFNLDPKTKELLNKLKFLPIFLIPFIVIIIAIFAFISNINSDSFSKKVTPDQSILNKNLNTITVTFITTDDNQIKLTAEVADTQASRETGLMNRNFLEFDKGMLFKFETPEVLVFWMKNTYLPLDIIFLNANKQIVQTYENATPLDTVKRYSSKVPALYALEVNAGYIANKQLKVGNQVYF
jgi:uncharacterized protein